MALISRSVLTFLTSILVMMSGMYSSAKAADPLSGAALYDDVRRYGSLGVHRYGSAGADSALAWIADELRHAAFEVAKQPFSLGRQYELASSTLSVGENERAVVPQWWMPPAQARFEHSAPVVSSGDATGKFFRVIMPFDDTAYLAPAYGKALEAAFALKPAAVLVSVTHPSQQIYTYNVDQKQQPWPVPVILVAPSDTPLLDSAEKSGAMVKVVIDGRYRENVSGYNTIGRIGRNGQRTIVVSTPVTSWFTSTCERGPGIAVFLALARLIRERLAGSDTDFVFVATGGHEIGHGGMEVFIHEMAPKPDRVAAWIHLGSSLACYEASTAGGTTTILNTVADRIRSLNRSQSLDGVVRTHFGPIKAISRIGEAAAVGELREIHAAGYPHFFGMAGRHLFFHTPADNERMTGPEILEPVARAFAETLIAIATSK